MAKTTRGGYPIPGVNKKGEPAKTPRAGIPFDKQQVEKLLTVHYGNISRTADALGCSRQGMQRFIKAHPDLQEHLLQCRQRFVDELESTAWQDAIDTKDTTMRIFLLKTQARERGYDQEAQNHADAIAKAAFEFVLNRSKNPAESENAPTIPPQADSINPIV